MRVSSEHRLEALSCPFIPFRLTAAAALLALAGAATRPTKSRAPAPRSPPDLLKWADLYNKATGNKVNYQSGSGAGIKQIKAKTVDFSASDMPLKDEELSADGLLQFPRSWSVVPVVNVSGVKPGDLKLTGAVLADIFMGKVTKWDDAAIKA